MTPEQFCYWLQGYAEIGAIHPSTKEWTIIKDHLATVFDKRTPVYSSGLGPNITNVPYITTQGTWDSPHIIC